MSATFQITMTEDDGTVWTYKLGDTRIYGSDGSEINVWDHREGRPGIDCRAIDIHDRVNRWKRDSEEAEDKLENAQEKLPPERVADGVGCVERVHPSERAFYEDGPYS